MLKGKIALVTGAGRGIGRAIAIELANMGATVAGVDYNEEYAKNISFYFNEMGKKCQGFVMNVADKGSIEQGLAEIVKTFGAPNILVNNAGIARDNLLLRMSEEEWEQVINTDLTSVYRLAKACMRDMLKARWGRIVNITSVVAYIGNAGQANYSAAKAGMVAFSKSLAQEIASRNVTVNCVAPGYIETDMTRQLAAEHRDAFLNTIPMKRAGQIEDVAKVVGFLVSDAAGYITGQTIHVNGGMFML